MHPHFCNQFKLYSMTIPLELQPSSEQALGASLVLICWRDIGLFFEYSWSCRVLMPADVNVMHWIEQLATVWVELCQNVYTTYSLSFVQMLCIQWMFTQNIVQQAPKWSNFSEDLLTGSCYCILTPHVMLKGIQIDCKSRRHSFI